MAGRFERRALQSGVAGGEGAGCAFAVDPGEFVVHDFLPRDVVADEIDQRAGRAGEDFLEGFEHLRVDQHVIDGREVRAEGHVVEVGVGLGGAEGGVDQFAVVAGQGNAPGGEMFLQGLELGHGQVVSEAARAAVGEEGDAAVAQAECGGGGAGGIVVGD